MSTTILKDLGFLSSGLLSCNCVGIFVLPFGEPTKMRMLAAITIVSNQPPFASDPEIICLFVAS